VPDGLEVSLYKADTMEAAQSEEPAMQETPGSISILGSFA